MTIKNRLAANLLTSLLLLTVCFCLGTVGVYRYLYWQKGTELVHQQVEEWLTLNFDVSQYLNGGFEAILSDKKLSYDELDLLTEAIIHDFINLERTARLKQEYLPTEQQELLRKHLITIRAQFGLIHGELEEAISLIKHDQKQSALKKIKENITSASLNENFVNLIRNALKDEEQNALHIEETMTSLRNKLGIALLFLLGSGLLLSYFITSRINRSIQKTINIANQELMRGTQALGTGNWDTQIHISGDDELSVVNDAFNKMTADLKTAWDLIRQQQVTIAQTSKMSALGEMAGGVAHEINNPLAISLLLIGQIQEMLKTSPVDTVLLNSRLEKINSTYHRIAKIVDGLRTFSRDGQKDPFEIVELVQVINDTLGLCQERFHRNGVDIRLENFHEPVYFEGRAVEISQVLLNIVNNAYDAIENLPEKWMRIQIQTQNEFVTLNVIDSGQGVPLELQNKVFDPFFTTKVVGKGTGLGLSISLGIIKNHGGQLKVSEVDGHTCFSFTLPIKDPLSLVA